MVIPALTRDLWIARLVVSELSLIVVLPVALVGLVALGRGASPLIYRATGTAAIFLSLLPFAATLPAYSAHRRSFSLHEYFAWGPSHPPVDRRTDQALEPSRPDLRLDFYRGHGEGPRPLLVIVHGGGFRGGDKGENQAISEVFADAGYSVADIQYRLSPAARFPLAIADVKCLTGRLRERAQEFGIDSDRVAYLGRSAGGAIAIIAAYSAGDARIAPACDVADDPVRAIITMYGPLDLEWGWRQRPFADPILGYQTLETYIGGTPATHLDAYRMASATSWVNASVPKTLLIQGDRDSIVSPHHVELLTQAFARAGLASPRQLLVPFADHGFDYHPGGLGEQLARAEILEFLAESLQRR